MSTEDPQTVISRVFTLLNRHDVPAIVALVAEDSCEDWPIVGRLEGRAAIAENLRSLLVALPDFRIEVVQMAAASETVFVQWRATGTFSGGPFAGIRATGRSIDLRGMDCFTVRDGKIVGNFLSFDGLAFATQAGILPRHGSVADRAMNAALAALTRVTRVLHRRPVGAY